MNITPELTAQIAANVSHGLSLEKSAVLAGTTGTSAREWMRRGIAGLPGDDLHVAFYRAVIEARARAELAMLVRMKAAAQTDWKAALAWLRLVSDERLGDVGSATAQPKPEEHRAPEEPRRLFAVRTPPR